MKEVHLTNARRRDASKMIVRTNTRSIRHSIASSLEGKSKDYPAQCIQCQQRGKK